MDKEIVGEIVISENSISFQDIMDNLIQKDNGLLDESAKYIKSVYPAELPVSSFMKIHKKHWWNFTRMSFFRSCKKVVECNWDLVSSQWDEINKAKSVIETDCCSHTEHLKEDLENSVNMSQYKQLSFYWVMQDVIVPVSKRIGKSYKCFKLYAYCPICLKIFCIGGIKEHSSYLNLIECNFRGLLLSMRANYRANRLLEKEDYDTWSMTGNCHAVWKKQKEIMKEKYNIIWYSPAQLNPHAHFD